MNFELYGAIECMKFVGFPFLIVVDGQVDQMDAQGVGKWQWNQMIFLFF